MPLLAAVNLLHHRHLHKTSFADFGGGGGKISEVTPTFKPVKSAKILLLCALVSAFLHSRNLHFTETALALA